MTRFRAGFRSEVGQVRAVNQDNGFAGRRLFAVADGMGGHAAGEVAARVAVETLQEVPITSSDELLARVYAANEAIFARSYSESGMRGMGTTLCTVALVTHEGAERLFVTNVGDSRVYVLQDGQLRQITRDHSFVEDLVDAGEITHEEARTHPNRNIVTRALGIEPYVEVDSWELYPFTGDRYLLCSDGLYNEVDDRHLAEALRTIENPQECADVLVRLANEGGGRDNITVLVVDVVSVGEWADELSAADDSGAATALMETGGWIEDVAELSDPAATAPVVAIAAETAPEPVPPKPKRKRLTWRVGAFAVLLAVVTVAPILIMRAWAGAGYTVTVDGEQIVLLKGRPGGVLWFEPDFVRDFDLTVDDVLDKDRTRLVDGQHYASLEEAERYVANLVEQAEDARPTTTTTTTSTTRPATTTTTRPATTTTSPAPTSTAAPTTLGQ